MNVEFIRTGDAELNKELGLYARLHANIAQEKPDMYGNMSYWYVLDKPAFLTPVCDSLHRHGARLAMVTAKRRDKSMQSQEVLYHFEHQGLLYTITVILSGVENSVPSVTHIFANADWHEREMIELYGINVENQPNPERLFLDDKLDKGLLSGAIPLSIMMNGASSTDLWERILEQRHDDEDATEAK